MDKIKEGLKKRANVLRTDAAMLRARATQLEQDAFDLKARATLAQVEAAEFDRLLAIYEAAK